MGSRVLTDAKGTSLCDKFSSADPNSVWNKIYEKHMNKDQSCMGIDSGLNEMHKSDDLITTFNK